MTGVEKHAQAILDRHKPVDSGAGLYCGICTDLEIVQGYPCPDYEHAEAVLVAARDHNTRHQEAIELIERIRDRPWEARRRNPSQDDLDAVAALRLLRGGEA